MSLPKGATVVMQVHYSAHNGIGASDQSALGIYFTKAPVNKRVLVAPVINQKFLIPAGAADYEVTASIPFLPFAAHLISVTPHMHLLGKKMSISETLPDGSKVCLAEVPDWDFNWQATYTYKKSIAAPFGSGLFLTSRYDNSPDNLKNPNSPPKAVGWGENTTDEMCIGFLSFTLDSENLVRRARGSRRSAPKSFGGGALPEGALGKVSIARLGRAEIPRALRLPRDDKRGVTARLSLGEGVCGADPPQVASLGRIRG